MSEQDRRYRYTVEIIDFVSDGHVQTADFMVAAQRDGGWLIVDREWPGLTLVTDTVAEALAKIGERVDNLIFLEGSF